MTEHMAPRHSLLLIIEDNPLLIGMYKTAFEEAGFDVILAHDGSSGLSLAKEKKPGVVLVDILLPGIDGLEVLREIKEDPETKDTKVLVLTLLNQDEVRQLAEELGADDFFVKSELKLAELVEKVISYFQ